MISSGRFLLTRRTYSCATSFNRRHNKALRKTSKEQKDEILKRIIINPLIRSESDINLIRNEIFKVTDVFSPENIDRSLLSFFTRHKQFQVALDYIRFLDEEMRRRLHLFLINQQFLIYFHKRYSDGCLPTSEQQIISQLYKNLRKESNVLNSHLLENAILALSVTDEWEHCLTLLDELKKLESPNNTCYSAVIAGAFLNKKDEIAWALLDEMFATQRTPNDVVFKAYLENLKKLSNEKQIIPQLEEFLQEYSEKNFLLKENSILELCTILEKSGSNYKVTSVNNLGYCENCKAKLDLHELGDDIFENLREKIIDSVIVGKNIFHKTSPAEFERFQEFLKSSKGCDVVIDGLNVAYTAGTKQTPKVCSTLLEKVVAHFVEKKKKVVVFGRKHMESWPQEQWKYIRDNAKIFLTQNISLDDPYLLYCTLFCGKNAILVSRDLMRSHRFLLTDPKDKLMFSRWLEQRQFQVNHIRNDGKIFFKAPLPYTRTVQHNKNCLHIPYETTENETKGINGGPDKWLCLRKS